MAIPLTPSTDVGLPAAIVPSLPLPDESMILPPVTPSKVQ